MTEYTGTRLLCTPRRIYSGDRPCDPDPQGQYRRSSRSEFSMFNLPDKLLGTHPLNWLLERLSSLMRTDLAPAIKWNSRSLY